MCKIFGVRTFHCLFKQRKLSTQVFTQIINIEHFQYLPCALPVYCKSFEVEKFCGFRRSTDKHKNFPVNYSSFLPSWNFFTLNDLQYMVVVFTFPHCCCPHSLLLVIYSDTTKLVSHGQTLNAKDLSTNPEWLYTIYNQ